MVQYANHAGLLTSLPTVEEGLDDHAPELGHDLRIWTNKTFDYIAPSVAIAREHLAARGMTDWIPEIEAMIVDHHKVTPSRENPQALVESFRRADWIDVSRGLRRFGLPRSSSLAGAIVAAIRRNPVRQATRSRSTGMAFDPCEAIPAPATMRRAAPSVGLRSSSMIPTARFCGCSTRRSTAARRRLGPRSARCTALRSRPRR